MPDGQSAIDTGLSSDENLFAGSRQPRMSVKIVRTLEDMMQITVVRTAVYMVEQDCPYEEEFDGNDFCATHLLGLVDGEPVACIRIRFFGDFAKLERAATRPQFRKSGISSLLIRQAFEFIRRKGFKRVVGHVRDELQPLWEHFGFKTTDYTRHFVFSDYSYTEMVCELDIPEDAIGLKTDPYFLIRPEGDWDRPGVLEKSVERSIDFVPDIGIAAE